MSAILLTGSDLTITDVAAIADGRPFALAPDARARIAASAERLAALIAEGRPIYGITTGFGALDGRGVARQDAVALQRNLLMSHAAGTGPAMSVGAVRAMGAIRANVLASGLTGARLATVESLIALFNAGIVPEVPGFGSVGACGDLAPLAHMALPLIGEGWAWLGGRRLSGAEAMVAAGLALPAIGGRDGIALINGTEQTTAIGSLALDLGLRVTLAADIAAALTMEALGALDDAFDQRVALAKPHPGQIAVSDRLRRLTAGSRAVLPPRPSKLRDALSLRCVPQVHGAAHDALAHAVEGLTIEINAANDNPLFGLADGWVTSNSGNFHGQRAGDLLDYAANALTSVAVISERRAARLVDANHNGGLPPFLIHPDAAPGVNSGLMIAQYTAASLVAELRARAVPGAIQSIPTCANTEDHVPMAPIAARRAEFAADLAARVVAIELLLAAQALDIRGLAPAPALAPALAAIREVVPVMTADRPVGRDIDRVFALVVRGTIAAAAIAENSR
jgi:histidine ammonia-lyase